VSDYTILRAADAPDYTGDAPGAFVGYGRPLGAEQVAVNLRVLAPHTAHVPPNGDPTRGHSHRTIEEIYLVLEGEVAVKLGDDVVTLGPRDAIRMAAGVPRATRNDGSGKAALVMVSVRTEDPRAESVVHEGFWPGSD
jgi:mannose-6-phosphate isomerase-like protein (cupin superfamily)